MFADLFIYSNEPRNLILEPRVQERGREREVEHRTPALLALYS